MTERHSPPGTSELQGGPLLVVISGPSGVGKDAVVSRMRELSRPCHFVVTATTRPMRAGEQDGVDYIFVTHERFQEMLRAGELLEHAQVYGRWYGVPRQQVKAALERGQDVIVKTDVQGAKTIRQKVAQALFVFIAPPSMEELERRLRQRKSESPEQLALRIRTAMDELKHLSGFDYVVVNLNGRIDQTVAQIEAIMTAERCRYPPRRVRL